MSSQILPELIPTTKCILIYQMTFMMCLECADSMTPSDLWFVSTQKCLWERLHLSLKFKTIKFRFRIFCTNFWLTSARHSENCRKSH